MQILVGESVDHCSGGGGQGGAGAGGGAGPGHRVLVPCNIATHNSHPAPASAVVLGSAPSVPQPVFTITEKAPTRVFSWLKAPTSAFTFKTLLRH